MASGCLFTSVFGSSAVSGLNLLASLDVSSNLVTSIPTAVSGVPALKCVRCMQHGQAIVCAPVCVCLCGVRVASDVMLWGAVVVCGVMTVVGRLSVPNRSLNLNSNFITGTFPTSVLVGSLTYVWLAWVGWWVVGGCCCCCGCRR